MDGQARKAVGKVGGVFFGLCQVFSVVYSKMEQAQEEMPYPLWGGRLSYFTGHEKIDWACVHVLSFPGL